MKNSDLLPAYCPGPCRDGWDGLLNRGHITSWLNISGNRMLLRNRAESPAIRCHQRSPWCDATCNAALRSADLSHTAQSRSRSTPSWVHAVLQHRRQAHAAIMLALPAVRRHAAAHASTTGPARQDMQGRQLGTDTTGSGSGRAKDPSAQCASTPVLR